MMDTGPAFALVLLAIPGSALLVACRLLFGRKATTNTASMRLQLSLLGWLMIWLAAMGAMIGICGPTPLLLVLLLGLLVVSLMVWFRVRRAEHRALVGALAAGIERNVAMPEMARAFAGEIAGGTGARALMLAKLLEAGMPLDAAVVRAPLWLGTGMHVAIRTGCALGLLGPALRHELRTSRDMEDVVRPIAPRLWYLAAVVTIGLTILTFMMLKIVPVMDRIFYEFNLDLPNSTVFLIRTARRLADLGPLTSLLYAAFLGILVAVTLVYIGVVPRNLPLLDRIFRRYDGAIVMRSLSLAVQRGMPLSTALALVGTVYPLRSVRRWLLAAAERVAAGASWSHSLRAARLIGRSDAAVLTAAERAGNLAWAMEEVADSLLRREVYRWQWWYSLLSPIVLVLFGFAVAFIVVSLFFPLVTLIQGTIP